MAFSNITVKGITPDLLILGNYQRFHFPDDPVTKFQVYLSYAPVSLIPTQNNIELRNSLLSGYRFHQLNTFDELFEPGTFKFQHFTNDGPGVDIFTYSGSYFTFNVPIELPPMEFDLDMGGYKIINLGTPTDPTDAATKAYVDSVAGAGQIILTGDVTGTGDVGDPVTTTLTLALNEIIPPNADLDLNSQKIINVADPVDPTDGVNKQYVDDSISSGTITLTGDITGSGTVGSPIATLFTRTLNEIAPPYSSVSMNSHRITNLNDPSGAPGGAQDAATRNYVDTRKLNNLVTADGNYSMGGFAITNLGTPVNPGDSVNKAYVDSLPVVLPLTYSVPGSTQIFSYSSATSEFRLRNLTDYTGSTAYMKLGFLNYQGRGYRLEHLNADAYAPIGLFRIMKVEPLADTPLITLSESDVVIEVPVSIVHSDATSTFTIKSSFAPFMGTPSVLNFDITNNGSNGYRFEHETVVGSTYGALKLKLQDNSTTIAEFTDTDTTFNNPVTFSSITTMDILDMNSTKIINLDTPVSPGDAVNKDYVDSLPGHLPSVYDVPASYQVFHYDDTIAKFTLNNTFDYTGGTPAYTLLEFENSVGNGYRFQHLTSNTHTPYGLFNLSYYDSGGESTLFSFGTSMLTFMLDVHINADVYIGGQLTMSAPIDMDSTNKIINLDDPTNPGDAANKAYVDSVSGILPSVYDVPASYQTFEYNDATAKFTLSNTLDYTGGTAANTALEFENFLGNGFRFNHLASNGHAPYGILLVSNYDSGGEDTLISLAPTLLTIIVPTLISATLTVNGSATFNDPVTCTDTVLCSNTLTVSGLATFNGPATFNNPVTNYDTTTMVGLLSLSGNRLADMGLPSASTDGANRDYVDTAVLDTPIGNAYMQTNVATNTLTAGVWAKVAGTTSFSLTSHLFSMPLSNTLQYNGSVSRNAMVTVTGTLNISGGLQPMSISVYRNGAQVTPSQIDFMAGGTLTNSQFATNIPVLLSPGDQMEVWIKSTNNTTSNVRIMSFTVACL